MWTVLGVLASIFLASMSVCLIAFFIGIFKGIREAKKRTESYFEEPLKYKIFEKKYDHIVGEGNEKQKK